MDDDHNRKRRRRTVTTICSIAAAAAAAAHICVHIAATTIPLTIITMGSATEAPWLRVTNLVYEPLQRIRFTSSSRSGVVCAAGPPRAVDQARVGAWLVEQRVDLSRATCVD